MRKIGFVYFLLIIFLTGCATWVQVGGSYETSSHNYKTELPDNWRRYNRDSSQVLITRDGFPLQWISVERRPVDKQLAFTQKKFSKQMLPQEAAEVAIDNFRSNPQIFDMKIIENNPALLGGYPGFKIVYQYQTEKGLTRKGVYYCSLVDDWRYKINYEAPARYYYERDLPALALIKKSFKLLKDSDTKISAEPEAESDMLLDSNKQQAQPNMTESEKAKATVAVKSPSTKVKRKTHETASDSPASLNIKEPWTGLWQVEGSRIVGGIWDMKQSGRIVKSTRNSYYEIKGKVSGKQLKGRIVGDYNISNKIVLNISSDGQSFKGTIKSDYANMTRQIRGTRK